RANRLAVEMDRTGAALREPTAEMRVVQREVVAQGVQERHVRIDIDRDRLAVHDQLDPGPGSSFVLYPRSATRGDARGFYSRGVGMARVAAQRANVAVGAAGAVRSPASHPLSETNHAAGNPRLDARRDDETRRTLPGPEGLQRRPAGLEGSGVREDDLQR